MIALARFVIAGPSQAALVAAATAILALMLPPLAWISGGVIALIVLHLGPLRGIQLMGFAGFAAMALGWLVLGSPMLALGVILLLWIPVWLAAVVLQKTVSLSLALQLIVALAAMFILLLQLAWPEMQTELKTEFSGIIQPVIDQQPDESAREELTRAVDTVLALLPGVLAAGMMFGAVLSLMLGRWWQASLFNPGGLGKEFNELRLGRPVTTVSMLLILASIVTGSELLGMLVLLVLGLFVVQGFAIAHGIIGQKKLGKGWLVGLYIMIFILPHLVILPMAVFGLTDAWVDIRRRLMTTN